MSISQQLVKHIENLPESLQSEVLDFVEYLEIKLQQKEEAEWSAFSITQAMRDIESEESLYTISDLKERF